MKTDTPKARWFRRGDRLHVRAQQIYLILVAHVMHRQKTMTYKDLAAAMGFNDPRAAHTLGRQLGIVGWYCTANDLPALNAIVVRENVGDPGEGVVLRKGRTIEQEQTAVLEYDWFQLRVPATGAFRRIWDAYGTV